MGIVALIGVFFHMHGKLGYRVEMKMGYPLGKNTPGM